MGFHRTCDLLQPAGSGGKHVAPRAAQEQGTIMIGIAFEDRQDEDEAIKRCELKNRGKLNRCCRQSRFWVVPRAGVRTAIFLQWPRIHHSYGILNNRPPGPGACPLLKDSIPGY